MLSDGTKAFVKFIAVLIFIAYSIQFYSDWSAARAEKERRASLTAEQRAMEDAAAIEKAEQLRRSTLEYEREQRLVSSCRASLINSLHDPGAASIDHIVGWFDKAGVYTGVFKGRAKNLYGAYVLAEWHCTAIDGASGGISVLGIKQQQ